MKKTTVILWGAVLIIIGALFAMNALGVGVDLFFEGWWTLFIIVPSIYNVISASVRTPATFLKGMPLA